jgi:transcriptional regulator with XRE-family HTH domain
VTAFAKWLRATRIKRGITQAQLAESVGVTHSYISHLEHGHFLSKKLTPGRRSAGLIDAMAQVLGAPCEEARRAARYGPPEPFPRSPLNPALMDMILKLPLQVQEDLKAHVETLYFRHCGPNAASFSRSRNEEGGHAT